MGSNVLQNLCCGDVAIILWCRSQVRGFCVDKSNLDLFDDVNVYGDIINSDIHHNCELS